VEFLKPFRHKNLSLKNRIVMAPMTRMVANGDGTLTKEYADYYIRRAKHGVGFIITEGGYLNEKDSAGFPLQTGLTKQKHVESWKLVTDAVHEPGAQAAIQLFHTGRFSHPSFINGRTPVAPSPIKAEGINVFTGSGFVEPRELSRDEINSLVNDYANAAGKAVAAGFDAVEIHGAHGYLPWEFTHEVANKRKDEYGGSLKNRMRFPTEIITAVRNTVGHDFTILYRYSDFSRDCPDNRMSSLGEFERAMEMLVSAGTDILHISTSDAFAPAYGTDMPLALIAKAHTGVPVIAVGGVTRGEQAEKLCAMGIDLVAVGRALLADPQWLEKTAEGRDNEIALFTEDMVSNRVLT